MKNTDPKTVKGSTKADVTIKRIRQDLITGRLKPGTHLKIHNLEDRYDVSQTTIREVLPTLANEGLLVGLAQKGYLVSDLSLSDLNELTSLRMDIEIPALLQAIEQGDTDWKVGILRAQHMLRKYVSGYEGESLIQHSDGWIEVHSEFHQALLAGCPSSRRKQYCRQLFEQSTRYFLLIATFLPGDYDALQDHVQLGDVVLSRDIDQSRNGLEQHIQRTHARITQFLFDRSGKLQQAT